MSSTSGGICNSDSVLNEINSQLSTGIGIKSTECNQGEIEVSPMGQMLTTNTYRLVGTQFSGEVLNSNFWLTTGTGNNATNTVGYAQLTMSTNTTSANGTAIVQSFRKARYIGGYANRYRSVIQLSDTGVTNNTRRWGAFDGTDGCYFELSGTTFSAVTLKGGIPAKTTLSFTLDTNIHTYEIYWTNGSVWFIIDDDLYHKKNATAATWANTMELPIRMENTNSNSLQTNHNLEVRTATIHRLGMEYTEPIYANITSNTTTILKYGAGKLHRITFNTKGQTNNTATIYDNTSGGGTKIGTIDTSIVAGDSIEYMCPFFTGLTIVTATGTAANITVIYE